LIQRVGIKFSAEGLGTVTDQMASLSQSVKTLARSLKKLETLNTSAALRNLYQLAHGMGNAASMLSKAAAEVNAATTAFTGANAALGRGRPGSGGTAVVPSSPGSPTQPKGEIGLWGGWPHELGRSAKLAKSLGTFYLLMKAVDMVGEVATTSFLGADRQRLLDPQLNLHAIGYKTQAEKRGVEYAAGDASFFYRGGIKKEDFMKSLAEMGSALPHDDPKAPAMNKQTHIDLAKIATSFAKMSQMTPDAGAQLMESLISAQYYMGKPELKERFKNQPGFTTQYASEIAGQSYKAIDIFKMRGQDIAESMKYLAPSMVAKGWNISDILTLTGYATTVGMKANMFARGMKSFLDANTGDIGEILLAGSPDENVAKAYKGSKPKDQKAAGKAMYAKYDKAMSEDLIGFLANTLSPAWERALSRGFDAKEFSGTNFLQAVRAILMKSSAEELLKARELVESGKGIDVVKEHKSVLDQDPGATARDALEQSWQRLSDAGADSSALFTRLGTGLSEFTTSVIDVLGRWQEWTNKKNREMIEGGQFISSSDMHTDMFTEYAEGVLNYAPRKPSFTKLLNMQNKAISDIYDQPFSPITPMQHLGQANYGFSMFNVPSLQQQPTDQKTTHEVRGQAELTVAVDDQGLFQKVKKLISLYPTTSGGGGLENSTGRHAPAMTQ